MKSIKRLLILIFVLTTALLVFAGCESVDTSKAATFTVTVETALSADKITFKSSRGKVTKDGKKFTVALDNRAGFSYTVSADGYETFHAEVSAKDFGEKDVLEKSVTLASKVSAVVTISFLNKEKMEVTCSNSKAVISYESRTATVKLPSREKESECVITVKGDGREPRNYDLKVDDIKNGYVSFSTFLTKAGTVQIEVIRPENNVLTSINYNNYMGEEVASVSQSGEVTRRMFYSVKRGESFVIHSKYITVDDNTPTYDALIVKDTEPKECESFKYSLRFNRDKGFPFSEYFVKTDNGYVETMIRREYDRETDTWFDCLLFEKPTKLVLLRNEDGNFLKSEWDITEKDLASKTEYVFYIGNEINNEETIIAYEYKNIDYSTGNIISEEPGNDYRDTSNGYYRYDEDHLTYVRYYLPCYDIVVPFNTNGINVDILDATIFTPFGKSYVGVKYELGKLTFERAVLGLGEGFLVRLSAYELRDKIYYTIAAQTILQQIDRKNFVGKTYYSDKEATFEEYSFLQIPMVDAKTKAINEYLAGLNAPIDQVWCSVNRVKEVSGYFLECTDWWTGSRGYRVNKESRFKLIIEVQFRHSENESSHVIEFTTVKDFSISEIGSTLDYDVELEVTVPYQNS